MNGLPTESIACRTSSKQKAFSGLAIFSTKVFRALEAA